jgi:hypothetical protein
MEKRSLIVVFSTTLLLVAVMMIIGNTALANTQGKIGSKDMENTAVTSYKTESLTIPPIDAAAPSTFETASFGLG